MKKIKNQILTFLKFYVIINYKIKKGNFDMKIEKKVKDAIRTEYYSKISDFISKETKIYQTAAGTFYIKNPQGIWVKVSIIVPDADEMEGTDGESLAEEYTMKCEDRAAKAEARVAKAEAAKAKRETKIKNKANR